MGIKWTDRWMLTPNNRSGLSVLPVANGGQSVNKREPKAQVAKITIPVHYVIGAGTS